MKVDAHRADARTLSLRQHGQREALAEEAARRFQKQLQRRRKEEEASLTGIFGPLEPMARLRDRPDEPPATRMSLVVQSQDVSDRVAVPNALDSAPWVDPEIVQMRMQESVRMDTIARAVADAGVKVAMAQDSGEYQVELGSALFTRSRLRVRAGEDLGIEVRCESDSASEREWFFRHREALAGRMAGLTGRAVHLDIADIGS